MLYQMVTFSMTFIDHERSFSLPHDVTRLIQHISLTKPIANIDVATSTFQRMYFELSSMLWRQSAMVTITNNWYICISATCRNCDVTSPHSVPCARCKNLPQCAKCKCRLPLYCFDNQNICQVLYM